MVNNRKTFEGQLYKYTNVMKGWQYRWFILDPNTGVLTYFMPDDMKHQRPRGGVKLSGAVISPSDEDSQTFSVNFATGDTFKLRAIDAKERQQWVNQLRTITQQYTQPISQQKMTRCPDQIDGSLRTKVDIVNVSNEIMMFPSQSCTNDAINEVKSIIAQTEVSRGSLIVAIESLPDVGDGSLHSCDKDLLIMKATSNALVSTLEQCLQILNRGTASSSVKRRSKRTSSSISNRSMSNRSNTTESCLGPVLISVTAEMPPQIPEKEEVPDVDDGGIIEYNLSSDDNKNSILYSLSQLKLGMDLTKVSLPTFILEPQSHLEMYSDFMGHPELFSSITDHQTPQERMIAILKWYLTSFHVGRPNSVARKPYNPILGETFRCSWKTDNPVMFVAEQVAHHPPTSAFYMECANKKLYLNAHLTTRSKFMGMSIGMNMVGEVVLCNLKHGEEYIITVPNVHARSILSVPWFEFGGKITITSNTGFIATSIFHTKPFYGGKLHRVTAEVKSSSGDIFCKVNGEWNGTLEFAFNDGTASTVNTTSLPKSKKYVQVFDKQMKTDSRRVWQHISDALRTGNISQATQHKKELEDNQRAEEKFRKSGQNLFQTQFFQKDEDGKWIYRHLIDDTATQ